MDAVQHGLQVTPFLSGIVVHIEAVVAFGGRAQAQGRVFDPEVCAMDGRTLAVRSAECDCSFAPWILQRCTMDRGGRGWFKCALSETSLERRGCIEAWIKAGLPTEEDRM